MIRGDRPKFPVSNTSYPLTIGVDLGGTKLAVAIVDPTGHLVLKQKHPVDKETAATSVCQIARVIAEVLGAAGLAPAQISGIGVAVPGIYDGSTGKAWAPNLWGNEEIPLRDMLQSEVKSSVSIESDRSAYVLGEQWRGVARGLSEVVFMAVGTGIGLGIITGGKVCAGAHGVAGAIGWFAVDPRKKAIYRQMGCLEAEAAGPAVARKAAAHLASGRTSVLSRLVGGASTSLSTETVVEAARQGDDLALEVLREVAHYLAMGVANVISILDPQMVVLGGGLMQAADLLLGPLRQEILEWAQPVAVQKTRIELSQLGEDAGLLGAARLAHLRQDL
jgi:glucokinase